MSATALKVLAVTVTLALALVVIGAVWMRSDSSDTAGANARRLVAAGARLVDVRTVEEYGAQHLDGAVNIPLHELGARMSEIGPPSTSVVVYCRSGARSGQAARLLEGAGFSSVHDLGPMSAWGPM